MRAGFEKEKVAIPSLLPNKRALVSNGRKRVTYNEGGDLGQQDCRRRRRRRDRIGKRSSSAAKAAAVRKREAVTLLHK